MVAASKQNQLGQNEEFTLHYFGLKGAQALSVTCLEQGDVPYTAAVYSMETWPAFKPKTPTGLLPLIEYTDGTMIPESGAVQRVCAAKAGLLGEGRDYALSEMLMGLTADLWKQVSGNVPTIMTIGNWDADKTEAWKTTFKPKVKAQLEKYAVFLKDGAKITSSGVSMGEMELWVRLFMLINGAYPTVLDDVPSLKPFYDRMSGEQGPSRLMNHKTKFGTLPDYFCPLP